MGRPLRGNPAQPAAAGPHGWEFKASWKKYKYHVLIKNSRMFFSPQSLDVAGQAE
jgi:hypothetical protein